MTNSRMYSWFPGAEPRTSAKLRLFCFPYAGAGASVFRQWRSHLPHDIDVIPVQLPGRESRALEAPIESLNTVVQTIAREITPLLQLPFAFFGHSMGALIAFETARRLRYTHHVSPVHLIVSGKSAPQLPSTRPHLHNLPEEQFIEEIRNMQGTPEEILQNRELMQLLLPRLRADFSVCDTYAFAPGETLPCPITVLGGTEDSGVSPESLQGWKEHTKEAFQVRMFRGNHFFLNDQVPAVTEAVLDAIRTQTGRQPAVAAASAAARELV
ncbi:thioesterase II family protein [Paenibacillus chartarius]|uniref:Thioesterase II family protein n=1 Tax=Paenibacillus chartarius TaxID=747481 RepID=A0ABV6DHC6_9BACL